MTENKKQPDGATVKDPKEEAPAPHIIKDLGVYVNERGQQIIEYELVAGEQWPIGMARFHGLSQVTITWPPGPPNPNQKRLPMQFDFPIEADGILEAFEKFQTLWKPAGEKFAAARLTELKAKMQQMQSQLLTLPNQPGLDGLLREGGPMPGGRGGRIFPGR